MNFVDKWNSKKQKRTYKEQKEFEALENQILELEEEKSSLQEKMASSDYSIIKQAGDAYKIIEEKLNLAYDRWNVLAELDY